MSIIILVLTMVSFLPLTSQAATITVGPEGCDYASIQAAIDAASPGDTVEVQSGTYRENVNVNKPLVLKGVEMPVVDAGRNGDAIRLSADGIWLEGFVVINASCKYSQPKTGASVISTEIGIAYSIPSITVTQLQELNVGIRIISNDNIIMGNDARNNYCGIDLDSSNNNTFEGNEAKDNYYGIRLCTSNNNTILKNKVSDNEYGIGAYHSSNNAIERNNAICNNYGVGIFSSDNNEIEGNNVTGNDYGISLYPSRGNIMRSNHMSGNRFNFGAYGHNDIDTTNFVDGKPVYYLVGASDKVIDSSSDAGAVYCIDCENVTVRGLTLKNNEYGIYFHNTSKSRIEDNNVTSNNVYGIRLYSSSNNTIKGNNATGNDEYGINLVYSSNNIISGNNVSSNNNDGISLSSSSNNTLFLNNLLSNKGYNAYDNKGNRWDNCISGNYYGDFNCTDSDGDEICDSAYATPGGESVDRYPLARWPWRQA